MPTKAKKTPRNRPVTFEESLVAANFGPAATPAAPANTSRLSDKQWRLALSLVWAGAAITLGIGLGRLILLARTSPLAAEQPVPVAKANIHVVSMVVPAVTLARATIQPGLVRSTATNPKQAQVGTPISTLSGFTLQGATGSDALQPGFNHFGRPQGNIGTTPVR